MGPDVDADITITLTTIIIHTVTNVTNMTRFIRMCTYYIIKINLHIMHTSNIMHNMLGHSDLSCRAVGNNGQRS